MTHLSLKCISIPDTKASRTPSERYMKNKEVFRSFQKQKYPTKQQTASKSIGPRIQAYCINQISGVSLLDSALHLECVVTSSLILQDGSQLDAQALTDTGCTRDDFMSESFYKAHPVLSAYQVKHPVNKIDLATHGFVAVISTYISIILQIVHRGKPIRCKILIGITKGLRYDLVLGLIIIASHYTDVLLDLLNLLLRLPSTASVSSILETTKQPA